MPLESFIIHGASVVKSGELTRSKTTRNPSILCKMEGEGRLGVSIVTDGDFDEEKSTNALFALFARSHFVFASYIF